MVIPRSLGTPCTTGERDGVPPSMDPSAGWSVTEESGCKTYPPISVGSKTTRP